VTRDLVDQATRKLTDRHAALGIVRASRIDAKSSGGNVLITDDDDVRNLFELGLSDA
jgi:hypothetical protein